MFSTVIRFHKGVACQQLLEWRTAQYEGAVHVPAFGPTKYVQLVLVGKNKMTSPPHLQNRQKRNTNLKTKQTCIFDCNA